MPRGFRNLDELTRLLSQEQRLPVCAHFETLRQLARHVKTIGLWPDRWAWSAAALATAHPVRLVAYGNGDPPPAWPVIRRHAPSSALEWTDDAAAPIEPAELLVISSADSLRRLADAARHEHARWIVIHAPLSTLRSRLSTLPDWHVVHHRRRNGGLVILSRDPADKKRIPALLKPPRDIAAERRLHGPGGELEKLLARLGISERTGCNCEKRARRMDYMGSDWCEANREMIVGWLREEAEKRRLLQHVYSDYAAGKLLTLAIRRSRKHYGGLPAIETRNLIYHIYPLKANDIWLRNLDQIHRRWRVFDNGRKIVAVAIDDRTHRPEAVADRLPADAELIELPNDPILRETASLPRLLQEIQNTRPNEATFFAHSKSNATLETTDGLMSDEDRIRGAARWRNAMYHHLLDRTDECMEKLRSYLAVGTTQMTCPEGSHFVFPSGFRLQTWMFAGTFFWLRHDATFAHPRWKAVSSDRYGAESWLGSLFRPADVFSMLQPWEPDKFPMGSPYNPDYYAAEFDDETA